MANPRDRIDTALKGALEAPSGDAADCLQRASEIVESLTAKTALPALERILQQAEAHAGVKGARAKGARAKGARAARRTADTAAHQCQVLDKEVARFLALTTK